MAEEDEVSGLAVAEYEGLRQEIVALSSQKTTIQLTLFTVTVAIVGVGISSLLNADSDLRPSIHFPCALVCQVSLMIVIMLACVHRKKNRATKKCGAYLLVKYSINGEQTSRIRDGELSFDDFSKSMTSIPWEIDYRYVGGDIAGKCKEKRFSLFNLRYLSARLQNGVSTYAYLLLAALVSAGTLLCLLQSGSGLFCGDGRCVILATFSVLSTLVIVARIPVRMMVMRMEKRLSSGNEDGRHAFRFFQDLSGDFEFSCYAESFLLLRCKRIDNYKSAE